MSKETRLANNARHRTLRMKTPKYTCAFMPGCNDTVNRSKLQEGQACACYSPIDPDTSDRVDCSSLIDEVTNQALHDKAQKVFKSGKGRKAVLEYRDEFRAMSCDWPASEARRQPMRVRQPRSTAREHHLQKVQRRDMDSAFRIRRRRRIC
jgi:hypothetical protein